MQRLELAFDDSGINIGGIIYDAVIVERRPKDQLKAAMLVKKKYVTDELGLDVTFHIEFWPVDDNDGPDMSDDEPADDNGLFY